MEERRQRHPDIRTAIIKYCDYQERCHQEVRNKLFELCAYTSEVEQYIATLIEENLLNEERYACAVARGRFRLKKWGRVKIMQYLKLHKISAYCIKRALKEIDGDEYDKTVTRLAEHKWEELKGERNIHVKKGKVLRFLQQKGFENDLAYTVVNTLATA